MIVPFQTDDMMNDPFPRNDPRAAEMWEERQRRNRSIRLMMMFLMMLLLMDGDENAKHRHKEGNLRYGQGNRYQQHASSSEGSRSEKNQTLPATVFFARRIIDERIGNATMSHSRYKHLTRLNNGLDIKRQVTDWVMDNNIDDDIVVGFIKGSPVINPLKLQLKEDLSDSTTSVATSTPAYTTTTSSSEKEKDEEESDEESSKIVHHYPTNATGYYKGHWKLVKPPPANRLNTKNSIPIDSDSNANNQKDNNTITHDNIIQSMDSSNLILEKIVRTNHLQKGHIGIHHLPKEAMQLLYSQQNQTQTQTQTNPNNKYNEDDFASQNHSSTFEISQTSGKVTFQLYSRSIPAMSEVGLLDGYVKIYDGNNTGYTVRNDILIRVRGIVIHSIGKISLVANDHTQSALVINDNIPEQIVSLHPTHGSGEGRGRSRKLQESKDKLLSKIKKSSSFQNIENTNDANDLILLRNNILSSYEPYWNDHIAGGEGWKEDLVTNDGGEYDSHLNRENDNKSNEYLETNFVMNFFHKFNSLWSSKISSSPHSGLTLKSSSHTVPSKRRSLLEKKNNSNEHHHEEADTNDESTEDNVLPNKSNSQPEASEITKEQLPGIWSNVSSMSILPYPYIPDSSDASLKQPPPQMERRISAYDASQLKNWRNCKFELNLDINETQWTVGEWRDSITQQIHDRHAANPATEDFLNKKKDALLLVSKYTKFQVPASTNIANPSENDSKMSHKDPLVMNIVGSIDSKNCNFYSQVNATASRTNWERTTTKAINYSFYMMLTCLTQIVVLFRQLLHTQTQSTAMRVSLTCIGWQAVIDAIICFSHLLLCVMIQPLFTAFAMVAFFKLLIFCVIEMKYMVIIMQARNSSESNPLTINQMRRRVAIIHLRFYIFLMFTLTMLWCFCDQYRTLSMLALYSFWVPQIIYNCITEAKKPLHPNYIYGISVTRLIAPIYTFAIKSNFLKEIDAEFPTDYNVCKLLCLWVGLQATILIAQSKYGPRFLIPKRFLPPKFDYSRPIPESLLPRPKQPNNCHQCATEINSNTILKVDGTLGETSSGPRNRKRASEESNGTTTVDEQVESCSNHTLSCVICHCEIDTQSRRDYMLAPCDHIFHKECLEQWMEVKMECPICRMDLPSI